MSPRAPADSSGARGQTLPDFAVGVALFLIAIVFVLVFVPQLTLPYEDQEEPVVVERVAADLTGTMLADGSRASKLNETCTRAFFNTSGSADGCPFEPSNPLSERLGITGAYSVNVTLRNTSSDDPDSQLCNDSFDSCERGSDPLDIGPNLPQQTDAVSIARYRVTVGDTRAVLEVGVW